MGDEMTRGEARAEAAAAKARAKAMRPWYRKKRWWAAAAVVAVVGISVGSSGDDPGAPAAADGTDVYAVGEPARSAGFEFTVHQVRDPYQSTNPFDRPGAGNRHVAVEVEARNVTSSRSSFSSLLEAEILDSLNRAHRAALAGVDLNQLDGDVPAGESRRGWVVFEVPADADGLRVRLKGSVTAQGALFQL